jgi:hypothetical protein
MGNWPTGTSQKASHSITPNLDSEPHEYESGVCWPLHSNVNDCILKDFDHEADEF